MHPIVSLELQSLSATQEGITSIGHGFREGDLAAGEHLTATVGDADVAVQMDVMSTWPDGSVKHAIVSFKTPVSAEGTATLVLGRSDTAETDAPAIDIAAQAAILGYDFTVTVDGETVDVAALLQSDPFDLWQSGALVTQGRVTHTMANGLELRADITVKDDGTIDTSIIMGNDNIETTSLDALTYAVEIVQDGEVVFGNDALTQYHFTVWREAFSTADTAMTTHAIYDMTYLRGTGLVPLVDTALTLEDGDYYGAVLSDPNATYDPLELGGIDNRGGIDEDRGRSGSSKSYGIITDDQHSYLVTQTAAAREGMLALTDQYGAYSDFYRNPETGEAYLLEDTDFNSFYSGIRKDVAGTDGVIDLTNDGFALRNKQSHDPSAFYTSYLVTGDRFYADGLLSEGGAAHLLWANAAALTEGGAVDFADQLRAQAWGLRDLWQAATLAPDASHAKAVLETRLEAALQDYVDYYIGGETLTNQLGRALTGSREAATFSDGPLSGVLQSYNGTAIDRPYWQDWFGMVIGHIAATGNENARALGEWMANFSAGRFLQDDFDASNSLYSLSGSASGSRSLTGDLTWAGLQTIAEDSGSAGGSVLEGSGFFAAAAWGGTTSLLNGTGDVRYAEALLWMAGTMTQQAEDAATGNGETTQFAIPVQFLDDSIVGITERTVGTDLNDTLEDGSGNRLIVAGAGNDDVTTGAGNHLVDGGDGNDTLTGGAGEDWLFGGSGNDRLSGGAGVNILQGDRHDADFGRFADTFALEGELGDTQIVDFTAGQDVLELTGFDGLSHSGDVLAAFVDTPDGALLDLGDAGRLVLRGIEVSALGEDDLIVRVANDTPEAGDEATPLTGTGWIEGWDGNDYILPVNDNVRVFGRDGDDVIELHGSATVAKGGAGDDVILFNGAQHRAWGNGGADTFIVKTGSTRIDIMDFDVADDALYFANGAGGMATSEDIHAAMRQVDDMVVIELSGGTVTLHGTNINALGTALLGTFSDVRAEPDTLTPPETTGPTITGAGWLNGTAENDKIVSGGGNVRLNGGFGDDHLIAEHWAVRMQGGAGDDLLEARAHDAVLRGDGGEDTFLFRGRVDGRIQDFDIVQDRIAFDIEGTGFTNFADVLAAMEDTEAGVAIAGADGDVLTLDGVDAAALTEGMFLFVSDVDTLIAPETTGPTITGSGWLNGTAENDRVVSGGGNVRLSGGAGDDHLIAEHWAVRMQGGAGDDLLEARAHDAVLRGDGGDDTFLFRGRVDGRIQDFDLAGDRIALDIEGTGFARFDGVAAALEDGENGVAILGENGDRLTLDGVREAMLTEDMFLFV